MIEELYAQALHAFEKKQYRMGRRPPLGTRWTLNVLPGLRDNHEIIRERRAKIREIMEQGISQREIAERLGVERSIVQSDLYFIRRGQ